MRLILPTVACILALVTAAQSQTFCKNASGSSDGKFFTLWHDSGSGCLTLDNSGGYATRWSLGEAGNLVAGEGWATGRLDRVVVYNAFSFNPGANGYLSLYGWSTHPLVEYYIVEMYGGFVPPGGEANYLGEFQSDGGIYRIYRTLRVNAPSIEGTATFFQYWSVRTARRSTDSEHAITFANHVTAWRNAGLTLGDLHYQIVATEGYGSSGSSSIRVR